MDERLRHELIKYLAGMQTLSQFEAWFLPTTWNVPSAFSASIMLHLAEHDRGDLDEDELAERLYALLGGPVSEVYATTGNLTKVHP